ncbi:MAG: hypothetical protein E7607_05600 [Ruminococcaceae bacterium]|nr:hypothetical protein [Oscillospiraceae bacterium]
MERWYWIELIGFDNESPDFGVDKFLSRNVTTTGVSILFSHIDFLFENNHVLPKNACSYGGHEYNSERRRQDWTKEQLRGLVSTLKERGIKVFLSCFDMTKSITDPAWLTYGNEGTPRHGISPIKRMGARTVGDEIIDRINIAIDFYGFDGLQLADGLSSNRRSIEIGDFSASFCADSEIKIPKELMGENTEAYVKRREWILKNARIEWTRFIADRWAEFYDKVFEKIKKPIMFNNAWTRDSFEALYRYGLDYRKCHASEAFAVMVEENSATRSITAACDEGDVDFPLSQRKNFTYEYALMQQNIRLVTNGLKQIALAPISDTMEQWDALRHCPTELMRSIVRRYNNFVFRNGRFEVCSDAPLYCLSDGIPATDWQWLASTESYRIPLPDRVCFAAVCNPDTLDTELEHFCQRKHYFGSALLNELVMGGLNLGAQLPLNEIEDFTSANCLIVTDLNTYTEKQKQILAKAQIPVLVIGENVELPLECSAKYAGEYISIAIYNARGTDIDFAILKALDKIIEPTQPTHGEIWTEALSYRRVDGCFFSELCKILNRKFNAEISRDPEVKVFSFLCGKDKYVLLSNDEYVYNVCTVDSPSEIKTAEALMKDKGYKVRHDSHSFTVRIPPRCVEIVRLEAE